MSDRAGNHPRSATSGQRSAWDDVYRQEHPRWRGPTDIDLSGLQGRILELGCGDGKTATAALEKDLDVIGLDSSRGALSAFSRRRSSEHLSLVQGDALDLPFMEASFDCVTAVHLLDHLLSDERIRAVVEMQRVLRPHGMVIGRFFSRDDMRFGKGEEIEENTFLKGNGVFNHYFSEAEVRTLFDGFDVVSIDSSLKPTKFPSDSGHRALITANLRKR